MNSYAKGIKAIDNILQEIGTTYLDLVLIHSPKMGKDKAIAVWKALIDAKIPEGDKALDPQVRSKMSMLPRGAVLRPVPGEPDAWPVLQCANVFVLPGVPTFFLAKLRDGRPPELNDLATLDREMYRHLLSLKTLDAHEVDALGLDFTATDQSSYGVTDHGNNCHDVVELVPGATRQQRAAACRLFRAAGRGQRRRRVAAGPSGGHRSRGGPRRGSRQARRSAQRCRRQSKQLRRRAAGQRRAAEGRWAHWQSPSGGRVPREFLSSWSTASPARSTRNASWPHE